MSAANVALGESMGRFSEPCRGDLKRFPSVRTGMDKVYFKTTVGLPSRDPHVASLGALTPAETLLMTGLSPVGLHPAAKPVSLVAEHRFFLNYVTLRRTCWKLSGGQTWIDCF